jgi:CheY-like chemotaxis protein
MTTKTATMTKTGDDDEETQTKSTSPVLADIRLNGPLDGIEIARRMQEQFDVRVVFLSAHSQHDTLERAQGVRASAWLTKPIRAAVLRKTLEAVLGKPDGG